MRIDKWLWAARFFKTRGAASEAVTGGKVELNGQRPKPARDVKTGDEIRLRLGPYEHILTVRALSERRGPASVAATLYEEDPAGKARRETLAERIKLEYVSTEYPEGKPSKKERRELERLKGKR